MKENNNSEKVMIKLGMKKEGELRKHQYHEGKWKGRLLYGLMKEEYINNLELNTLTNYIQKLNIP